MQLSTVLNTNNTLTMGSREIADLTGKKLSHVHRDIRTMIDSLKDDPVPNHVTEEKDVRGYTVKFTMSRYFYSLLLDKYKGLARVPMRLQEEASLKTIEQLLGVTLIRQYKVLEYRIDGYDPESNTAYEIDEPQHNSKSHQTKDLQRQQEIESVLGCKFVRIKL